jgi:16S rRNA U516 pseudouridylate synthase RsuA-like enzyme
MSVTTRINKLLANRGLFSRLEATAAINKGWVRLGGRVLASGDQVPQHSWNTFVTF